MIRIILMCIVVFSFCACGPINKDSTDSKAKCKKIVIMYKDYYLQKGCIRGCGEMLKMMSSKVSFHNPKEIMKVIKKCQSGCLNRISMDNNPIP